VNRADIRRRLEVLAWDCPLHYDESVAGRTATAVSSPRHDADDLGDAAVLVARRSGADAGDPPLFPRLGLCRVPAPGEAGFVTSCETEYFEPVYPGDRITATSVPTEVTRKTLAVGDGAFISVTTTYTKQTGEVVASNASWCSGTRRPERVRSLRRRAVPGVEPAG